jgi:inositol hexakisphosphate/diphosphoinositol-pentakisphosphate kinase
VKLPKSFLAVNLSESHTFHKKEELEVEGGDDAQSGETSAEPHAPLVNGSAPAALAESNSISTAADTST